MSNPTIDTVVNATVEYPLRGTGLWDRLRTISLQAFDKHGQWAQSETREQLSNDVLGFVDSVYVTSPTISWGEGDEPIQITGGQLKDRFQCDGCADTVTNFIVSRVPHPGEIVTLTEAAPTARCFMPMSMLHTNVFVSQFRSRDV